ncbi:MAG: cation:dicarboxylase symporter family transporter, partial [Porticoccaceae bacterium]|nr:cation:dicarboxylase symporter family transporter [Porticoccaceae bacterium]
EGIALIIGVDRLLDMVRTAVNITGDGVVSCIVAKSEDLLDEEIYNDMSDPNGYRELVAQEGAELQGSRPADAQRADS